MKKTLEEKLNDLLFPKAQARKIINDILDDLCETNSEEQYNKRVEELKKTWIETEKKYTANNPPYQFVSYSRNANKCKLNIN